jgi:hypothetical protein
LKKQTIKYPTVYVDAQGELHTTIENNFDKKTPFSLSMKLNGVQFQGSSFDDFELVHPENYSEEILSRFTLNQLRVWKSEKYIFELCNCTLNFQIPIVLIDIQNNTTIPSKISIELQLGKPAKNGGIDYENAIFKIALNNKNYISEGDVFEDAFVELQNQFKGNYHFKNCFGCLYSDYSPFGNGFFGNLFCFKNTKKEYLAIKDKHDLIDLMEKEHLMVQETHYCQDFEKRIKNTGYRG